MFYKFFSFLLFFSFFSDVLLAQQSGKNLITTKIEINLNGKDTTTTPNDTLLLKMCFGDSVFFSPQLSNIDPSIDTSILNYEWVIGGIGFYQTKNLIFKPKYSSGYYVTLNIYNDTDIKIDSTFFKVQVSAVPIYNSFKTIPSNICMDKVVDVYTPKKDGTNSNDPIVLNQEFYGVGGLYKSNDYIPDGVPDKSDIEQVCISMEHSFLGDLEIVLTCPSGKSAVIMNAYSGPGVGYVQDPPIPNGFNQDGKAIYLGNDLDDDSTVHGFPHWQYCFSSINANFGTMGDEYVVENFKPNIIGNPAMNPDGIYLPEETFDKFIGCPIKGDWTLKITDYQSGDNGYVFDWGIMFNSKAFPNIENYQNKLTKSEWQLDSSGAITNNNQDTTYITPKILGKNTYKYIVATDYGCTGKGYDTTITIQTKLCLNIPNVMNLSSKVGNNVFYINTGDVKEFKCEIFNRWGDVLSVLTSQKEYWDGRNKSGKIVSEGVYFYKLNITFNNGTSTSQNGDFLLMH